MDAKDIERQLEALLNEVEPYIDDAGFTRSMLDRLPPPTRRPEWLKPAVLISATVLSSLLAVIILPESTILAAKVTEISSLGALWTGAIFSAIMVGLSALSLAIAKSEL